MALVPNECDQFKARLTCRSNWKILETIKNTLGGDNKKKFKKSCFGHFWRMERLKFQGQLYLHLLFRQDTSGSTDKIVFHINNKEAEFGMNEFSLITGLHFGPKQQIPTCSDLHKNVFRGKPILYLKDVEDALKSVAEKDKGRGENSLKVALLYFLYGILIVRDRMKKIDMQYIHLADNLEMFNKYPWGRVTFEFLVADTRSCMDGKVVAYWRRVEKKKNHTMEWFDVCGFTHALQVWAYEMMPDVAKLCATRVHKNEGRVPRILQWSATSVHSFEELKRTVFFTAMPGNQIADHITVLPKLEASLEESKEPFYESLVVWQEELAKSKQEKLERRAKKMKIIHEAPREEESAPQDQWSKKRHDPPQPAEAQPQSTEAYNLTWLTPFVRKFNYRMKDFVQSVETRCVA